MKKYVKIIAAVLALALALCGLCACGSTGNEAGKPEEKKVLTMGSSCDFPPYEYVGDNGGYEGIDVDIATDFCEKNGYTLEIQDMEFKSIIAAVNSGAVDFGMSGFTITEERKNSVNFSDPYDETVQSILVKEGSPIKSKDDLAGKKIGVQAGTTGDDYCTADFGQDAVNQYDKYNLAITALLNDQVDCVVLDDATADAFLQANEGIIKLDTAYATEQYAVTFNFDDTELLNQFNAYLAQAKADGTIDAIFAKYDNADA